MSRTIPWRRTLGAKLGVIAFAIAGVSLVLIVTNVYLASSIQGDSAQIDLFTRGRYYAYEIYYLLTRLLDDDAAKGQTEVRDKLKRTIKAMDDRYDTLESGDPERGIPAVSHPRIMAGFLSTRATT